MSALETQSARGWTIEGGEWAMLLDFDPADGPFAMPVRISGEYTSRDGGGSFLIERTPTGYKDQDGNEHQQAEALLPWVITGDTTPF